MFWSAAKIVKIVPNYEVHSNWISYDDYDKKENASMNYLQNNNNNSPALSSSIALNPMYYLQTLPNI